MTLPRTPSQTVGPFYEIGLCRRAANVLADGGTPLRGRLLDGEGAPVDGLVELWDGKRFARSGTRADGGFEFVVDPSAPYLDAIVFARGLLRHQFTRIYLSDADDDLLGSLDERQRATLLARPDGDGLRFDIHLQGDRETVFLAV